MGCEFVKAWDDSMNIVAAYAADFITPFLGRGQRE